MTVIDLPTPPSVNGLFFNRTGGRSVTRRYKEWRVEAGYELIRQRPGRFLGPVAITLALHEPNRTSDLDNRIKPVLDLLVEHQVIENDDSRYVRRLSAEWDNSVSGVRVSIEPYQGRDA
jgi:Holliday junction resolvase RusA-like endonuclease